MRILLVANGYPPAAAGGVETYIYHLANHLAARGHSVHVFCRHSSPRQPDFQIQRDEVDGIPVSRLVNDYKAAGDFRSTYQDGRVEQAFQQLLEQTSPEIIHYNHLLGLSCQLPLLSSRVGAASVFTLHDFWFFCARTNLVDWQGRPCPGPNNGGQCYTCMSGGQPTWQAQFLPRVKQFMPFRLRQSLRKNVLRQGSKNNWVEMQASDFPARQAACQEAVLSSRAILAPSEFLRRAYVANGYPAQRIQVLPLGVEKPTPTPAPRASQADKSITFAYAGSLLPGKGLHVLLGAFRRLKNPSARLQVYGRQDTSPPDYRRKLADLARGDARIRFMGAFTQEQRLAVYQQIDVLVLPSLWPETFSFTAREALVYARPVIAADAGALPEIIQPGVNGFLFPPGDEEALLHSLETIASQPSLLDGLDLPGPRHIPSMQEHVEVIESIYQEAVST